MKPTRFNILVALLLFLFGGVVACIGGYLLEFAWGMIQVPGTYPQVPRLAGTAAGLLFLLPGLWMVFKAAAGGRWKDTPLERWANYLFVLLLLLIFSGLFLWIGFGAPAAAGSGSASRLVFGGIGALVLVADVWYAVARRPAPKGGSR